MTREDVARAAGTSTAVVSYVINDGPRPVAEKTRQRVLAAIEEVGYEPDTIAQALASGVSGAYGLIVPDIANPYFAALAHVLADATSAAGRVLLLGDSIEDAARESELIRSFARRKVDGLLLATVDGRPDLTPASANRIPVVVIDRIDPRLEASTVAIDNVAAARAVTEHLIAHGYASHGIVCGPADLLVARDRLHGWSAALDAARIEQAHRSVAEAPFTRGGGREAGLRLLDRPARPRAIFASSEAQAVGVLSAAAERGLRVPDDVAVMSFDGTETSDFTVPKLSSAVQPLEDIARAAVSLLGVSALGGKAGIAPTHQLIGFDLRLRASCGTHRGLG
ncbi:LacI family transcriptional regulator [Leifsonia shinshuensis]|uniref:LacI family DNA-binding transcriptional regulator n=1 Tax=Leifsonia shinshuensis TaxID=150026 RepID=UPI001F50F188|nr:LacI family DNA-binding transcriptional regulator [Leifsonia shinshuensis]MCI0158946.1 LacI family transcriptional regulator [Leifsonia shinshuensis]